MGHKQTLKLLKIQVKMFENYTFETKWPIFAILRKCQVGIQSALQTVLKLALQLQFLECYIVAIL